MPMPFVSYLITDGSYGSTSPDAFAKTVQKVFETHRPDYALYRDKQNPDYARFAAVFVEVCRQYGVRAMLHRDSALALGLGAEGVHLTASQFDEIVPAKTKGLYTVISTHDVSEAAQAGADGADAVTYSPVYASPGKGAPKGLEDLKETAGKIDLPVIALGGIVTPEQIRAVEAAGAAGFASIRYFSKELFCSK
jgi:thiamine-phosphate pyrophosphorylase